MNAYFRLEIVGGPYDGAPDLVFVAQMELPDVIVLNRCPGDGRCRMGPRCRWAPHVAYWIPGLGRAPTGSIEYVLQEDSIEVDEVDGEGSARYVLGRLDLDGVGEAEAFAGAGARFGTVVNVERDGRTVSVRLWEVS